MSSRQELIELILGLDLVSKSDIERTFKSCEEKGGISPWKTLRNEGLINQPQCDTLVMAEKGYIPLDAARITIELHTGFRTNGVQPGSNAARSNRMDTSQDTVELESPTFTRRSSLRVVKLAAETTVSDTLHPTPYPPESSISRVSTEAVVKPPNSGRTNETTETSKAMRRPSFTFGNQPIEKALIGKTIGKFCINSVLGKGATGIVFLGHHQTLDIPIALKILDPTLSYHHSDMIFRFFREARTAARINHPNVIRILDCDEIEGLNVIAMEYVEGVSLHDFLEENESIPEERSLKIILSVASGLESAHNEGVIHRDIKPANIMLTKSQQVKLADLGLGKLLGGDSSTLSETSPNVALGTPHFFAPEQALDASSVDHRADIYSLGATMYNILTGSLPFKGSNINELVMKHANEPLVSPSVRNESISLKTSSLVLRMMAKSAADRPQTYAELIDAINDCIATLRGEPGRNPYRHGTITGFFGQLFKKG